MPLKKTIITIVGGAMTLSIGVTMIQVYQTAMNLQIQNDELYTSIDNCKSLLGLSTYSSEKTIEINLGVTEVKFEVFNDKTSVSLEELSAMNKILLIVTDKMCDLCVHQLLAKIEEMRYQDDVIVLIESHSGKDLTLFRTRTFSKEFRYLGFKALDNEDIIKTIEKPILTLIDDKGRLSNVFIPINELDQLTKFYLARTLNCLRKLQE